MAWYWWIFGVVTGVYFGPNLLLALYGIYVSLQELMAGEANRHRWFRRFAVTTGQLVLLGLPIMVKSIRQAHDYCQVIRLG